MVIFKLHGHVTNTKYAYVRNLQTQYFSLKPQKIVAIFTFFKCLSFFIICVLNRVIEHTGIWKSTKKCKSWINALECSLNLPACQEKLIPLSLSIQSLKLKVIPQ